MLVVVCNEHDDAARRLVAAWPGGGALRLTARDLSTSGWRLHLPDDDSATAVLGGRRVKVRDVTAVVVRYPAICASDVPHIAAPDRDFVATEMTAFLAAWLMTLRGRVLNRPTATCLCGPPWRRFQWIRVALGLGIPADPLCQAASPTGGSSETSCTSSVPVTIVGGECIGEVDDELKQRTRRLAAAAGAGLLTAYFSGPHATERFLTASIVPDVDDPAILDALHRRVVCSHVGAAA